MLILLGNHLYISHNVLNSLDPFLIEKINARLILTEKHDEIIAMTNHYKYLLTFLFCLNRYYAIIYPFHSDPWIKTHKISAIMLIWLTGLLIGTSQLIKSKAVPFEYNLNSYYDCREEWTDFEGKLYTIFIFGVTFVIPIVALIFVYTRIGIHLLKNETPGIPDRMRDTMRSNRNIKVLKK